MTQPPEPMTKTFFFWIVVPLIAILLFLFYAGFAWAQLDMYDYGRTPNPLDWIAKYQGRRMG